MFVQLGDFHNFFFPNIELIIDRQILDDKELRSGLDLLDQLLKENRSPNLSDSYHWVYVVLNSRLMNVQNSCQKKAEIGAAIFLVAQNRLGEAYMFYQALPNLFSFFDYVENYFIQSAEKFQSNYAMQRFEAAFASLKNGFLYRSLVNCLLIEKTNGEILINESGISFVRQFIQGKGTDYFDPDHKIHMNFILDELETKPQLRQILSAPHRVHADMLPFVLADLKIWHTTSYAPSFAARAVLLFLLSPKKQAGEENTCYLVGEFNYSAFHEICALTTLAFQLLEDASFQLGSETYRIAHFEHEIPKQYPHYDEEIEIHAFNQVYGYRSVLRFVGVGKEEAERFLNDLSSTHSRMSLNAFINEIRNHFPTAPGLKWLEAYVFGCSHNLVYNILLKVIGLRHHNLEPDPSLRMTSFKAGFWKDFESDFTSIINNGFYGNEAELLNFLKTQFIPICKRYLFFNVNYRRYAKYEQDGSLTLKSHQSDVLTFTRSKFTHPELELLEELFTRELSLCYADAAGMRTIRTKEAFIQTLSSILSSLKTPTNKDVCDTITELIDDEVFEDLIDSLTHTLISEQVKNFTPELLEKINRFVFAAPGGYCELVHHLVTQKEGSRDYWRSSSVLDFMKTLLTKVEALPNQEQPVLVSNRDHLFLLYPHYFAFLWKTPDKFLHVKLLRDFGHIQWNLQRSEEQYNSIIHFCVPFNKQHLFLPMPSKTTGSVRDICREVTHHLSKDEQEFFEQKINEYMRNFYFDNVNQVGQTVLQKVWQTLKLPLEIFPYASASLQQEFAKMGYGKSVDLALLLHKIFCKVARKDISIYLLEHLVAIFMQAPEIIVFGDLNHFSGPPEEPTTVKVGVGFNFFTGELGFFQRSKSEDLPLNEEESKAYLREFAFFHPKTSSAAHYTVTSGLSVKENPLISLQNRV